MDIVGLNRRIVIIGGGMGGLFTGAFLAKEGCVVTVLEKNREIGGGLQTFRRFGSTFDTGLHTLGGFCTGGTLDRICRYLGIRGQLELRFDDCLAEIRYLKDGSSWNLPHGRESFVTYLSRAFPDEASGIRAYVDALYALSDEVEIFRLRETANILRRHSEHFFWPADALIAHYVSNARLRDLLAFMNPLYAGVSGHSPAYIHALINVLYMEGSCRFADGSGSLAHALAGVIEEAGGEVVAGDAVTLVSVTDKEVREVVAASGRCWQAGTYISAVHPLVLLDMVPATAFPRAWRQRLNSIPETYSAFTVYVKFRPGTFPYMEHTCYYQDDYGLAWRHGEPELTDWPRGFMYFTPPVSGQGPFAGKMIINCVMAYECVSRWAGTRTGHRGEDYEHWKAEQTARVMARMETLHPGFSAAVERVGASSPLTIRDFYATPEGALFGYRKDCDNTALSYLPVKTKVRNLLLTGQNVNLHGICGVPLTAILTAEAIVGSNVVVRHIAAATATTE